MLLLLLHGVDWNGLQAAFAIRMRWYQTFEQVIPTREQRSLLIYRIEDRAVKVTGKLMQGFPLDPRQHVQYCVLAGLDRFAGAWLNYLGLLFILLQISIIALTYLSLHRQLDLLIQVHVPVNYMFQCLAYLSFLYLLNPGQYAEANRVALRVLLRMGYSIVFVVIYSLQALGSRPIP
jgi:hypothetical protein